MKPVKEIKVKPIPWSSYQTITIDKDIVNLVSIFNEQGLETTSCCSGHVGEPLSTIITFMVTYRGGKSFEKLKKLVNSRKLGMSWQLDCHFKVCNLFLKDGLYGSKKLIGNKQNMDEIKKDFKMISNKIK